jgi:hypothetical protein
MRAASALLAPLLVGCAIHSFALRRQCNALHAGMSLREAIAVVTVAKGDCLWPHRDATGVLRCIPEVGGEPVLYGWHVQIVGSADPDACSVYVNRSGHIVGVLYLPGSGSD